MQNSISRRVYRMKHLPGRTGLGTSLIYREIKEGNFPEGQWIAPNIRIWTEEVIEAEMQRRFSLYNKTVNLGMRHFRLDGANENDVMPLSACFAQVSRDGEDSA